MSYPGDPAGGQQPAAYPYSDGQGAYQQPPNQNPFGAPQPLSASSLVGLQVTYPGADGTPVSGVVTSAVFGGADGPVLRVGTDAVPLTQVTEVTAARAS